jgi:hypothetical protein
MRGQGESPDQSYLSNSVLAERAAQGIRTLRACGSIEGFTSRAEHLGWFWADSERLSGGQAPVGAPSGLRLRGQEP